MAAAKTTKIRLLKAAGFESTQIVQDVDGNDVAVKGAVTRKAGSIVECSTSEANALVKRGAATKDLKEPKAEDDE